MHVDLNTLFRDMIIAIEIRSINFSDMKYFSYNYNYLIKLPKEIGNLINLQLLTILST